MIEPKPMNKEEILKMWKEIVINLYQNNETRSPLDAFAEWHIKEIDRIIAPIIELSNKEHNFDTWELDAGKAMAEVITSANKIEL